MEQDEEGWVHREENSTTLVQNLLCSLAALSFLGSYWPLAMLASSGSSFFVALRCHHNLFSSSPSFAPSMPFSSAGSLQGHGSSKVAFPLIALQWLIYSYCFSHYLHDSQVYILGPHLWVSGSRPHLSVVLLHLEVSKTPLDQIPFIFFTLVNETIILTIVQRRRGGKPGFQPDLSLLQLIRILFIFILSTVQFHYIHPHCPYSSLHALCVLCRVRLFVTPRTIARQTPLSMGFLRQE